jgi:hypothetical protein
VAQHGEHPAFAPEAFEELGTGAREKLERDGIARLPIVRSLHDAQAALAGEAFDREPVRHDVPEAHVFRGIGRGVTRVRAIVDHGSQRIGRRRRDGKGRRSQGTRMPSSSSRSSSRPLAQRDPRLVRRPPLRELVVSPTMKSQTTRTRARHEDPEIAVIEARASV